MIYAISDVHGCYDKYIRMLDVISFSDEDTLYVLGDAVDRGPDGIKVLLDIAARKNVIFLRGNHDVTAYRILRSLFDPKMSVDEEKLAKLIRLWTSDGGNTTLEQFLNSTPQEKRNALNSIYKAKKYAELEVNGRQFFMAHTVPEFELLEDFESCPSEYFILGEPDYEIEYFPDKYIVTGHTPTGLIEKGYEGRIYMKNNHIAIDCGAVFGGRLGCVRLDDLAEFYV